MLALKNIVPWIHCIEYIFLIIHNFEQHALALINRVWPEIHWVEIFFIFQDFWGTLRLPWKQSLSWNFWLYLMYFLHSGCLSNFCLPWKIECGLSSLYWICIFYHSQFWTTCACPKNRVFPENFHCIKYSFYIKDIWTTWACPEKQSVPWIHCIEYIYFLSFRILNNLRLPWKTEFALKFFSVLKYFLSFRIFEQLELALKTELALNFSRRGAAAPPASYATVLHALSSSHRNMTAWVCRAVRLQGCQLH